VNVSLRKTLRRAVSPLLATIILIAITVAAGLVIYNLFFSTAGTVSTVTQVDVMSCDLIKTSAKTMLSITVKNSGNKPIYSCNVTIWDGSSPPAQKGPWSLNVGGSAVTNANPLNPGGFASLTAVSGSSPDPGTTYTVGNTYPVRIDVRASDGSTFTKSFTVVCQGGS